MNSSKVIRVCLRVIGETAASIRLPCVGVKAR
ncbi:hypothetical protein VP464E531_P0059 [Vibrio phage 464E53-1]|nr:hypothetical protein VP464E531_P0059 [Vibrio phage 464E53-1]